MWKISLTEVYRINATEQHNEAVQIVVAREDSFLFDAEPGLLKVVNQFHQYKQQGYAQEDRNGDTPSPHLFSILRSRPL